MKLGAIHIDPLRHPQGLRLAPLQPLLRLDPQIQLQLPIVHENSFVTGEFDEKYEVSYPANLLFGARATRSPKIEDSDGLF